MPEQNTNRLWFMLFTVMIGALLIFGYNDGARATAQNIFDHLNGLLSGDVISADEREDLELVTDVDGNSYVELNEGHFASKNKVSVWLKVVKVTNRDNPDEIIGYEIVDAGTSIDNIKSGNGGTSIKNAGIRDIDFNITIEGKPVVSIGNGAFKGSELSGDVNLGDVTSVGADAFAGSNFDGRLTGEKVSSIGSGAFSDSSFSNSNTPNLQIVGSGNDGAITVPDKETPTKPSQTKPSDSSQSSSSSSESTSSSSSDSSTGSSSEPTTPSSSEAEKDIDKNVSSDTNETGSAIYANIRHAYKEGSKTFNDVWVELVKENNGWLINEAGNAKAVFSDGTGLSGEISFDILVDGLPIVRVADGVFQNASFSGNFYGNNLTEIGSNSFKNSVFTGSVQLPNVTKLGSNAFAASMFTGFFEANSLTDLGSYVFSNSTFTKGFYADSLRKVYVGTFPKAQFSEQISPLLFVVLQDNGNLKSKARVYDVNGNIEVIQNGNDAVVNLRPSYVDNYQVIPDVYAKVTYDSDIAGWIVTKAASSIDDKGNLSGSVSSDVVGDISFDQTINGVPIKVIKPSVFESAVFDGVFYGSNLTRIGNSAFKNSVFTGDLNLPNITMLESYAFRAARFTGDLNIPKIQSLDSYTFTNSAFSGSLLANVLYSVDISTTPLAKFKDQQTPNLTIVGTNNGNVIAKNKDYDINGNVTSIYYNGSYIANIRPDYSANGASSLDVWVKIVKNATTGGWDIVNAGNTKDLAAGSSSFTSTNTPTGTISFNQTIDGLPITGVADSVFKYSAFTGDFYGDNLITVGSSAFSFSKFDGQFHGKNLTTIGSSVFYGSVFSGDLNLPNVKTIGSLSFYNSIFDGDLNIPKLTKLESVFGGTSTKVGFKGKLTANVLTSVANNTFGSNTQFSEQYAPNLAYVGTNNGNVVAETGSYTIDGNISSSYVSIGTYVANIRPAYSNDSSTNSDVWIKISKDSSTGGWRVINAGTTKESALGTSDLTSTNRPTGTISFNQTIDGLPITSIDDNVFKYSAFTGNFYGDNLRTIGDSAFLSSKFNGPFYGDSLISIGRSALYGSTFSGDLNLPNVTTIGSLSFYNSIFDGDFNIPKLTKLESVFGVTSTKVAFKGTLTANVLTKVINDVFGANTQFSEQYAPNLAYVGTNNGNVVAETGSYTIDGNISSSYVSIGTYVANIRPAYSNDSSTNSDVWIKISKDSSTGGWRIINAGTTSASASGTSNLTSTNRPTGTISFNQTIDGLPITSIDDNVFYYTNFTGDFYGDNLRSIGEYAFFFSKFDGEFYGKSLTTIGRSAFYNTQFSEQYTPKLTTIGMGNGNLKQSN